MQARAVRAEFEANRNEVRQHAGVRSCCPSAGTADVLITLQGNREMAERMLTHGEQLLKEWRHPDPIIGKC